MTITPIKPRLVVRNISKYDVNILGKVKIRPGEERDIYSELEYNEFGSLTSTVLKELESPDGEIYRLWKINNAIRIIDFVNSTYVGSGISADSFSTSNAYFDGAVLGYEAGELKWLTAGGGGGGTVTAVTASSPLSSSGGTAPDISFSGWPTDTAGTLTNDGSGNLSWVPVAPTPPGGGVGDIQLNDGAGGFTGSTDLSYSGLALSVTDTVHVTNGGDTLTIQAGFVGSDAATLTVDAGATVQLGGVADVNIGGAYTLPSADGTAGQILVTDGYGVASWSTPAPAGVASVGASSPLASSGGANPTISLNTVGVSNGGTGLTTPGSNGNVLTSNGTSWVSSAPTGGPPSGAAGGDLTGSTYPNPIISSFGGKTHWVVQGGKYATLQAAVDAAAAEDVIFVGPKATGDWGNVVLNVVDKPLIIAATPGAGANKIVKIGSVTYDLGTTGPVLNVNLNETYLYGLYIQGAFTGSAVTLTGGANYPGRLRLYGCYILNSSSTGAAAVTNSNLGANSSLYLDSCVVSLPNSTTGSAVVQTAGYTIIRNRCDVSGSSAASATGNAINASSGTVEIYDSYISIPVRAGAVVGYPTINVTGATTFVSAGYSTILNGSDAAGAACANIGTAGARFGAGDATLAAGTTLPTSAVAVSGVAGGSFLYANVSFSFVSTVSTVTSTATPQSGGLFSYGLSVGTLLGTTFAVNASGNITKINNVTTSFPSAQGSANQVLTNNGSGTLTWSNGNLRSLGSCPASPTAANLRTNATYTVNVAAVALPAMAAGDDGLTISLVNISGAGSTVTPSTGVARTMTTGGGQTWVWRNTGTTWYCISNV